MVYRRRFGPKALGIAGAVLVGIAAIISPHFDRDVYTATVTDKERIVKEDSSKYLVFTELQDKRTKVFQNSDSFLELKFNSSDMQGKLKEGKTYEIKTYGWRVPFLSWYENIVGLKEVQGSS